MASNIKAGFNAGVIIKIVKGVLISTIISLVFVLIHAMILKFFAISDSAIPIINQVIKGISIFLASIFCIRGETNGWLKGFFIGVFYMLFAYVVFSLLYGGFDVNLTLLNDVVLGAATGILSGIICANIKNSKNKA